MRSFVALRRFRTADFCALRSEPFAATDPHTGPYAGLCITMASGAAFDGAKSLYPNVADGVDGMNFITQCVASSAEGGTWMPLKHAQCR